jgi:hypothetical protein
MQLCASLRTALAGGALMALQGDGNMGEQLQLGF